MVVWVGWFEVASVFCGLAVADWLLVKMSETAKVSHSEPFPRQGNL